MGYPLGNTTTWKVLMNVEKYKKMLTKHHSVVEISSLLQKVAILPSSLNEYFHFTL